jgi:uncharacterized protein YbaP (TraB family)
MLMRALIILCLLIAQAAAAQSSAVLWSVRGEHNTVYLAGSLHFLPASEAVPPAWLSAYRDAEKLVMELDMDDIDPAEAQLLTLQQGLLPPEQSLEAELGGEAFHRVQAAAEELGLDAASLQRMRPWLAALTLTQLQLLKLGWTADNGIEQRFTRMAKADGKEIRGLETLAAQIGLLASMSPELQRQFVLYSVDDTDSMPREVAELGAAWRSGEVEKLEALLHDNLRKYPALYEPLTVTRNRIWMQSLEPLLEERDDYLVIVGAAHLLGRDSVVDLLRKRGFTVTRC